MHGSIDRGPLLALILSAALFLGVLPVRAATCSEQVGMAKAKELGPKVRMGLAGIGTPHHMTALLLQKHAGLDMTLVPYKDTMQSAQDTIGGLTQMVIIAYPSIEPLVKAGKLKLIAVSSPKRFPGLEPIRTLAEDYAGFSVAGWFVLVGPAKLPNEIALRLNREMDAFLKEPETQTRMRGFGFAASGASNAAGLEDFLRNERDTWKRIVADVGLKPE